MTVCLSWMVAMRACAIGIAVASHATFFVHTDATQLAASQTLSGFASSRLIGHERDAAAGCCLHSPARNHVSYSIDFQDLEQPSDYRRDADLSLRSMKNCTVVKVPRADADDESVLLRIEQDNPNRLDLALFGTDGEHVYVGKIRHSTVEKLQNKSFNGSLEDWQTILFAIFSHRPDALAKPVANDVELATIAGDQLTIIIRKNIDGITQRLGEVVLKQKDDEEISLFDWTLESAAEVGDLRQKGIDLQRQITKRDKEIEDLKKQVQNAASERDLYVKGLSLKFSELLNSKKAKIRDQQRLLKSANLSSPVEADGEDAGISPKITAKGKKRKAENGEATEQPEDDDASEAEGDGNMSDAASSRTRTPTPGPETSGDDSDVPRNDETASKAASDFKHRANSNPNQTDPAQGEDSPSHKWQSKIPPRRELPVGMRPQRGAGAKAQPGKPEDDDEETDDEL
ncbi:hypothetical protein K461DRAFT_264174 [Myriangium duriaei CBS 260.36]|uniref:Uncharacterized protein n=1 Tax=Myriangium duriaei CBS 260.36 TaxID=1168546 RepID=A0A9P4JE92_9PEZI|nr:hypothetical protein K461DRAFT_264174 [Myriangium duriaei CBS 260.36]